MVGLLQATASLPLKELDLELGAEQREVTVAFADLRGFTTLADCIPPNELLTVLNAYLSTVVTVFHKYEGMIDKFGGDSILAIWNAPLACREHALLATAAAVEAQRAIKDLQRKRPTLPRINFGIGINTGQVIAGDIGGEDCKEYTVIGDTVNIAARLTGTVPGGRVWITASTFDLARDYISAKPLDPIVVKGKRHQLKAYEVTELNAGLTRRAEGFGDDRS